MLTMSSYITDSTGAALQHSLPLFTGTLVTSTINAKRNAFNSSKYVKK
jgi:hypothetical protein